MFSMHDLTGQSFGPENRVAVLSRAPNSKSGAAMWNCYCSCGRVFVARGTNLTSGHTTSCGHARGGNLLAHFELAGPAVAPAAHSPKPRGRPTHDLRIRIELWRGAFDRYEFGFAVMWLPPINGNGPDARPFLTVAPMPRPRVVSRGQVNITLARALFELQREGWVQPRGERRLKDWLAAERVEVVTMMTSTSDELIRRAYHEFMAQHDPEQLPA